MTQTKELVKHIKSYKRAAGMRADEVIEKLVEAIVEDGQGAIILGMFDMAELAPVTTTPVTAYRVRNWNGGFVSSHKQWSLDPKLSAKDLQTLLGKQVTNQGRSGDGKCNHHWEFTVDGQYAAIWDYKGARWSGYGPRAVFDKLGIDIVGN